MKPPSAQSLPSQPEPKPEPQPEPELELAVPEEEPSLEQQLAARRAKRAAILAKYAASATSTTLPQQPPVRDITPSTSVQPLVQDLTIEDRNGHHKSPSVDHEADAVHHVQTTSRSATPAGQSDGENDFSLTKEESAVEAGARVPGEGEQVSAADYDPSLDRREDEQRRARGLGATVEPQADAMNIIEEVTEEEEDVDDMFAIITSKPKTRKKVTTVCYAYLLQQRVSTELLFQECCKTTYHHDYIRLCCRSRRLLPNYSRRTARWREISGVFFSWQGNVFECSAGSYSQW